MWPLFIWEAFSLRSDFHSAGLKCSRVSWLGVEAALPMGFRGVHLHQRNSAVIKKKQKIQETGGSECGAASSPVLSRDMASSAFRLRKLQTRVCQGCSRGGHCNLGLSATYGAHQSPSLRARLLGHEPPLPATQVRASRPHRTSERGQRVQTTDGDQPAPQAANESKPQTRGEPVHSPPHPPL